MDISDEYVVHTVPNKRLYTRYCSYLCWYEVNKDNSVKKDAFPQHNISNAKYKEILIIIYLYKYTFSLAIFGG